MVTKDEDFVERILRSNAGPQVVWIRIGNCTNRVLFGWLEPVMADIIQQIESGSRVIEVLPARL